MSIKKLKNTSNISNPSTDNNTFNVGHYWGTTTTGTGNYLYPTVTSGTTLVGSSDLSMNSDIIEYIDVFYQLMGIDMDYKRFSIMTKEEKRSFIRDLKLQKLIDDK